MAGCAHTAETPWTPSLTRRSLPCAQDFINIELDSHRNQLIQLELLLTAAMFAMALVGGACRSRSAFPLNDSTPDRQVTTT